MHFAMSALGQADPSGSLTARRGRFKYSRRLECRALSPDAQRFMEGKSDLKAMAIGLAALLLAGCGIERQNVRLDLPELQVSPANGPAIVVGEVKDSRTPTEGLAGPDPRKNIGGALRGGNGIAVDLDMPVAEQQRQIVTQALRSLGYQVFASEQAPVDAPRVNVEITTFDVQMPFNFLRAATYSQQMVADIQTNVTVISATATRSFKTDGHGTNVFQRVIPENWEAALNEAIDDYTKKFKKAILADQ
jgi:hypothetical protein